MYLLYLLSMTLILHGFHICSTSNSSPVLRENSTISVNPQHNFNESTSVRKIRLMLNNTNSDNTHGNVLNYVNMSKFVQYCRADDKINTWKGIELRRTDPTQPVINKRISMITPTRPIHFPQLSAYRKVSNANNIHDILGFVNNEMQEEKNIEYKGPKGKIKFYGSYIYPRKMEEMEQNNVVKSVPSPFKQSVNGHAYNSDPLMPFKPSHPGDINLLATKLFRFSPANKNDVYRYSKADKFSYKCTYKNGLPCVDYKLKGTSTNKVPIEYSQAFHNQQYKTTLSESTDNSFEITGKKVEKKRPLSVILDLYPMDDADEEIMQIPDHLKDSMYKRPQTFPHSNIKYPEVYTKPNYHQSQPYPGIKYSSYNYPSYYHYTPFSYIPYRTNSRGGQYNANQQQNADIGKENNPIQMRVYFNVYPQKKYS